MPQLFVLYARLRHSSPDGIGLPWDGGGKMDEMNGRPQCSDRTCECFAYSQHCCGENGEMWQVSTFIVQALTKANNKRKKRVLRGEAASLGWDKSEYFKCNSTLKWI